MFRGAAIGALVGFLVGAAIVLRAAGHEAEMTWPFQLLFTAGPLAFFGGVLGAAVTGRKTALTRVALAVVFGFGLVVVLFLTTSLFA